MVSFLLLFACMLIIVTLAVGLAKDLLVLVIIGAVLSTSLIVTALFLCGLCRCNPILCTGTHRQFLEEDERVSDTLSRLNTM